MQRDCKEPGKFNGWLLLSVTFLNYSSILAVVGGEKAVPKESKLQIKETEGGRKIRKVVPQNIAKPRQGT